MPLAGFVAQLWQQYGLKLIRYCGVSVFNLVFGQSLLLSFHSGLGWPGWIANVAAVVISAGPAYLLSRHWVWQQSGPNSLKAEVLPFWSLAILGLLISTVAVAIVDSKYDGALPVMAASIGSFFLVWIFKFFVLDKWMWRSADSVVAETV
jgi:putative flippase GtrA